MDDRLQITAAALRKMASAKAADCLITRYPMDSPDYWEVFQVLPHVSWKRADQIRLAQQYLQKMPFASAKPYAVFCRVHGFRCLDRHFARTASCPGEQARSAALLSATRAGGICQDGCAARASAAIFG
ncbi:MAG: hypothetical protein WC810_16655 [Janthinobacterium sp.]